MVPTTLESVTIVLLAIAPGYLAIHAFTRARTWQGFRSDLDTVLKSLVASLLVQVPMFPLAIWAGLYANVSNLGGRTWPLFVWLLFTVVMVPVAGGILTAALYDDLLVPLDAAAREALANAQAFQTDEATDREKSVLGSTSSLLSKRWWLAFWIDLRTAELPTVWDEFFLNEVPNGVMLQVQFIDNTYAAGSWEDPGIAKTSPHQRGLFLPREISVDSDGRLLDYVPNSNGLLIVDGSTIKAIRVINPEPEEQKAQEDQGIEHHQ